MLRITPEGGIPVDNPFQGPNTARCNEGGFIAEGLSCQEAYAVGLRSPYRFARDVNAVDQNGTPFDRFFFPDLDPELTDDDYSLFNASIGFTGASDNWDIIIWGKNLTDEEYLIGGARNRDAGNAAFGATPIEGYRVTAGEERTYGITLKYRVGGG